MFHRTTELFRLLERLIGCLMLNKILRIIVGLPFVTIAYVLVLIINVVLFCGFFTYTWVIGEVDIEWQCSVFREMTPISPYQFVKDVWKD